MVRDPLARLFAKVNGAAQLHVRTYASVFRISKTAGRVALKFGRYVVRDPLAKHLTKVDLRHVHTCASLFHISSIMQVQLSHI